MNSNPEDESFLPTNQHQEEVFNSDNEGEHREGDATDSDPWDQYLIAIKDRKFDTFKELLDAHPEFATRIDITTRQPSVFHIAQIPDEDTSLSMLKYIVEKGADPAFKDGLKQSIVFYTSRDNKLKVLDFLISHGVPVNIVDSYQQTPLYYAARDGHTEMCKRLIELGVDPNHSDLHNQTCLFYAAKLGRLETCQYLVDHGAKPDHTDNKKQTPLFWAKKSNNQDLISYFQNFNKKKASKPVQQQPPAIIRAEPQVQPAPVQQKIPIEQHASSEASKAAKRKREKEEPKHPYRLFYSDEGGNKMEMTYAEFERFKKQNPKIAELLMNPDKIQSVEAEQREKESWERIAKKIIQALWKMKGCYHFHTPVDPIKLNCFDYFDIVKNPMDFGTIKSRLSTGYYDEVQQFIDDMNLVFNNCILYNGINSEVGKVGAALKSEFEKLCQEYGLNQFLKGAKSEMKFEEEKEMHDERSEQQNFESEKVEMKEEEHDEGNKIHFSSNFESVSHDRMENE